MTLLRRSAEPSEIPSSLDPCSQLPAGNTFLLQYAKSFVLKVSDGFTYFCAFELIKMFCLKSRFFCFDFSDARNHLGLLSVQTGVPVGNRHPHMPSGPFTSQVLVLAFDLHPNTFLSIVASKAPIPHPKDIFQDGKVERNHVKSSSQVYSI